MSARAAGSMRLVTAIVGVALVAGASLTVLLAQVRERDAAWSAPPEAAAKVNPLLNRPDAAAGGAKLFQQRCATCHGEGGRGTSRAPDLSGPDVQLQTDGELYWKITTGNTHGGMPAFSFLPKLQRWQLVLQVRAIATRSSSSR
jgi:mono/diheme cytochrome c family protein